MADMICLDYILLDLLHIVAHDIHIRILLPVNGSLLKSHKHFRKLHGSCRCAKSIPIRNVILIRHDTNLLA